MSEVDGLLPGTYFAYDPIFINGKKYEDENREFGFRTFEVTKVQSLLSHLVDAHSQKLNRSGNGLPIMIPVVLDLETMFTRMIPRMLSGREITATLAGTMIDEKTGCQKIHACDLRRS